MISPSGHTASLTSHPRSRNGKEFLRNLIGTSRIPKQNLELMSLTKFSWGSGCDSVGRAVASDTRRPRFESSHRQKFIYILNICFLSTVY